DPGRARHARPLLALPAALRAPLRRARARDAGRLPPLLRRCQIALVPERGRELLARGRRARARQGRLTRSIPQAVRPPSRAARRAPVSARRPPRAGTKSSPFPGASRALRLDALAGALDTLPRKALAERPCAPAPNEDPRVRSREGSKARHGEPGGRPPIGRDHHGRQRPLGAE